MQSRRAPMRALVLQRRYLHPENTVGDGDRERRQRILGQAAEHRAGLGIERGSVTRTGEDARGPVDVDRTSCVSADTATRLITAVSGSCDEDRVTVRRGEAGRAGGGDVGDGYLKSA